MDIGVDADLSGHPGLAQFKVRRGSRNMLREAAMSEEELIAALSAGLTLAEAAFAKGHNLIAVGEMGIGNTTAASVLTAALPELRPAWLRAEAPASTARRMRTNAGLWEGVVNRHFAQPTSPREILRCGGGLEIAAMTGMILGAARYQMAVVMDGFISTAAAAIACSLAPAVRPYLFAGHRSQEPGHRVLLAHLAIEPILS